MAETDDLWTAIRRVLPDAEAVAAAVATELGEPLDDVRPSVLIGTIALNGQLGPEAMAVAAIEAELSRIHPVTGGRSLGRRFNVDSLDTLLAEARALEAKGALDLDTIVEIQRASGAIAARGDRRLVVLLHRYAVSRRLIWEHCVAAMEAGRLNPSLLSAFGRFLLLWNEPHRSRSPTDTAPRSATSSPGWRRLAAARCRNCSAWSPSTPRARPGCAVSRFDMAWIPTGRTASSRSRRAPRPIRSPSGRGSARRSSRCSPDGSAICSDLPGRGPKASGRGPVPAVLPLLGRIAVLAGDDWAGLKRVPNVLDSVVGGLAAAALSKGRRGEAAPSEAAQPAWVAVGSASVDGVGLLAATYADLIDATRTAQRLGLLGWISDPQELALERLLLVDRDLADATVRGELGPVLADERLGEESSRHSRPISTPVRT